MAALCWYPPTGHGYARYFDCEGRKCPVDFVSACCDGGAGNAGLLQKDRKFSKTQTKDAVLQKGGRLPLNCI